MDDRHRRPSRQPPSWARQDATDEARRRDFVERRIQEAMEQGAFDNLPGAGRPLNLDEAPPGREDLWWALRTLKNAGYVTDEVRYRRVIDELRSRLLQATSSDEVRRLVRACNTWIIRLNTMGTNVIPTSLAPLDEEAEVRAMQARVDGTPVPPSGSATSAAPAPAPPPQIHR